MTYEYEHKVHFYETDQMGVVHHSNHIKWMEESRVYAMEKAGAGYKKMTEDGIDSPVLEVSCKYLKPFYFDEIVVIKVIILSYDGRRLKIGYEMWDKSLKQLHAAGESSHCFVSKGSILRLNVTHPYYDEVFRRMMS